MFLKKKKKANCCHLQLSSVFQPITMGIPQEPVGHLLPSILGLVHTTLQFPSVNNRVSSP